MKIRTEEFPGHFRSRGVELGGISEDAMLAYNEAMFDDKEFVEVSDNTFEKIAREEARLKIYNDVSTLRLTGMKAESDDDVDGAIKLYAEAIETGEASEFDLLHAYRHAYDRIIVLLSRTRAHVREAEYIEQLLKRHNLQNSDRTCLEERLRKTYMKISK